MQILPYFPGKDVDEQGRKAGVVSKTARNKGIEVLAEGVAGEEFVTVRLASLDNAGGASSSIPRIRCDPSSRD